MSLSLPDFLGVIFYIGVKFGGGGNSGTQIQKMHFSMENGSIGKN
jgi:hypothetical protein